MNIINVESRKRQIDGEVELSGLGEVSGRRKKRSRGNIKHIRSRWKK